MSATQSMRPYLEALMSRRDLSTADASAALRYAVSGSAAPAEIAAFLALLAAKGETAAEVAGVARAMRDVMVGVDCGDGALLDIVGTGGDGFGTVNISTAASVLAAACGCRVAKHGNRSVSSKCGSADVLEELGVEIDLDSAGVAGCVRDAGVGFMYAPVHHPAMRHVAPVRKALGVRTVMNVVGPLLNPAGADCGVIGVYSPDFLDVMADALVDLGMRHALVVHTAGLDEFSVTGVSDVVEVRDGVKLERSKFDASEVCGLRRCSVEELRGGDRGVNAAIIKKVLAGEMPGAMAEAIALNAGVGCYVYGLDDSIQSGVERAMAVLKSGDAMRTLNLWVEASQCATKVAA
jgi:anthranilate phosphoribosyltransferase